MFFVIQNMIDEENVKNMFYKVIRIETHNSDFLQYPVQTCFMPKPIIKL